MKYFNLKFLTFFLTALLAFGVGWAETVTDELTVETFEITGGTGYATYSDAHATSAAVYTAMCAGGQSKTNPSIQLRSNNDNSGIITTVSGGKVRSVTIAFNSYNTTTRTINIFGKNTAYSAPSNLWDASTKGTQIGSISSAATASKTVTITGDYEYVGIASNSGAAYIDKITIVWETEGGDEPTTDPWVTVNPSSLNINDVVGDNNKFEAKSGNIYDDYNINLGVTPHNGFSCTGESDKNSWESWGFRKDANREVDGIVTVSYDGRELYATDNILVATTDANKEVAVTYRPDIYLYGDLSDNNQDNWGYIADGQMERNGDIYSKTITLNEKGFLLFARKTGETYGWNNNRLFFGPATNGENWGYVSDSTNAALDLDPQSQYHPLELPAGIYTITIDAANNTFSISREELPTPIGEACPAVIEFKNNYNANGEPADGTANFADTEKFLEAVSAGSGYIQSATWNTLYQGATGLKFSSGSANGSLTINLKPLTSGSWRANKIIVNATSCNYINPFICHSKTSSFCKMYYKSYIFAINALTFEAASPLNTAEPATIILAPAFITSVTLSRLTPPSTSISTLRPLLSITDLISLILSRE